MSTDAAPAPNETEDILAQHAQDNPPAEPTSEAVDALSDDEPLVPSVPQESQPPAEEGTPKAQEQGKPEAKPDATPQAEPTLEAVLAKDAARRRGEDVTFTAKELDLFERHQQSIRDQEAAWQQAEEQRKRDAESLAARYDEGKARAKDVLLGLVERLTGRNRNELDSLTLDGVNVHIDPLFDSLKAEAERIVLTPVLQNERQRVTAALQAAGIALTPALRNDLARADASRIGDYYTWLGELRGIAKGMAQAVDADHVVIPKKEYEALKTAQETAEKASQRDSVPPTLTRPGTSPVGGDFISQVASGARVKTSELTLDRVLAEIPDEPLIPTR